MGNLITKAIPTDDLAIKYLKEHPYLHDNFAISPFIARELFDQYILDKRNFICPTNNCPAPITCRSISPASKNSPAFVNQSISDNKHISSCNYHPKNYDSETVSNGVTNEGFKQFKTGDTISDLPSMTGFSPKKTSKTKNENTEIGVTQAENKTIGTKKTHNKNDKHLTKAVKQHLKTLQDHVEMYKFNPEFKIIRHTTGAIIPIKYLFKPIVANYLFENLSERKYPSIYYGKAYLDKTNNNKVLRINFISTYGKNPSIKYGVPQYRPSLIISREHIENEYTDIYDEFINKEKNVFEVYITLPLFWNFTSKDSVYLNFSSFVKPECVDPFSEELFYNIYIS
ncbi:hypothetical protein [Enterococcus sp. ZJ1622]|uniref:hypothetical protein n=1 Tax=Enterococcus sp. ZJ1622 TaxID=2709401 RepID=UPI0013ECE950|nr:hypothetical protein [Enterococcus sp. ZJ1622]